MRWIILGIIFTVRKGENKWRRSIKLDGRIIKGKLRIDLISTFFGSLVIFREIRRKLKLLKTFKSYIKWKLQYRYLK